MDLNSAKVDGDLLLLLQEGSLAPHAPLPVVVRCDRERLDEIEELIKSRKGRIRHRLDALSSVSAWVSNDQLAELSHHDGVVDLELPQTHRLAAL
jgi:hypothetical protein